MYLACVEVVVRGGILNTSRTTHKEGLLNQRLTTFGTFGLRRTTLWRRRAAAKVRKKNGFGYEKVCKQARSAASARKWELERKDTPAPQPLMCTKRKPPTYPSVATSSISRRTLFEEEREAYHDICKDREDTKETNLSSNTRRDSRGLGFKSNTWKTFR
jgi:hypothetical protein